MRILSIDYDYFVDADAYTRNHEFPTGVDSDVGFAVKKIWDKHYSDYPELRDIGVIIEEKLLRNFLSSQSRGKVLIKDSYRGIQNLFQYIKWDKPLEVVNVDYHHDCYFTGGSELNCANWLRILMEKKPDTRVTWIRREDSEVCSLAGEFPYEHTTDLVEALAGNFEYIFICLSPEWTPPHLEPQYEAFLNSVSHLEHFTED